MDECNELAKFPDKRAEAERKKKEHEDYLRTNPNANVAAIQQGPHTFGHGTMPTVEVKICREWKTRIFIDTGASGTALIINPTLIKLPSRIEVTKMGSMHLNIGNVDYTSTVIGTCMVPFEIEGELFVAPTILCPKFPVAAVMAYDYAKNVVFDDWGDFKKVRVRGTEKWAIVEDRSIHDRIEISALVAQIVMSGETSWITPEEIHILPGISKPVSIVPDHQSKQTNPIWERAPELHEKCHVWTHTVLTHEDINETCIIVSNYGRLPIILQAGTRIATSSSTEVSGNANNQEEIQEQSGITTTPHEVAALTSSTTETVEQDATVVTDRS
jgi:hypothetical protein